MDDDDITPTDFTMRPLGVPRGRVVRGSAVYTVDSFAGQITCSNHETIDPWDLAIRRPKWAGAFAVVKANE